MSASIPPEQWVHCGSLSTFYEAEPFRLTLHTHIGDIMVSTVTDRRWPPIDDHLAAFYMPGTSQPAPYATLVLEADPHEGPGPCPAGSVADFTGKLAGRYQTEADARAGHEQMCRLVASATMWAMLGEWGGSLADLAVVVEALDRG